MPLVRQASKLPLALAYTWAHLSSLHAAYIAWKVFRIKISYVIQYLCFLLMRSTIEQPCPESIAHTWLGHQYSIVSAHLQELAWFPGPYVFYKVWYYVENLLGFLENCILMLLLYSCWGCVLRAITYAFVVLVELSVNVGLSLSNQGCFAMVVGLSWYSSYLCTLLI